MLHSIHGASGSHLYLACNASTEMSRGIKDEGSESSRLGNAGHSLGEFCLTLNVNTYDCLGAKFNSFTVDENMADAVQMYVSYVRSLEIKLGVKPTLEQMVFMTSIGKHVFGTSDCFFIIGDTLYVIDYKHGFIPVSVANNSQAIFYAIAILDTYGLWGQIKHIKTAIVQPRKDHIDGAIREHDYDVSEMYTWLEKFRQAIMNPNPVPVAGEHCIYCPARGKCRARMMRTLELTYGNKNSYTISYEETMMMYNEIGAIRTHTDEIEMRALMYARQGKEIPGKKLVKAIKRAKCKDEKGYIAEMIADGTDEKEFYEKKLISMSAAKRKFSAKRNVIDKWYIKPPADSVLADITDSRPALSLSSGVKGVFNAIP